MTNIDDAERLTSKPTGQAVPKQEAEETATEIMTSISQALHENLPDLVYQLQRIADQLELVTGTIRGSEDTGYVRVANIE